MEYNTKRTKMIHLMIWQALDIKDRETIEL